METPILPDWIRHAQVPGYVTAHELCPGETQLYGTESLYGDWGGSVLLLAKDFGPCSVLHDRKQRGEGRPYRHARTDGSESGMGVKTNRMLKRLTEPIWDAQLLYGSALANLLRTDGRSSGSLPNRAEALAYGTEVTRFVIEHMPNLRWIVCLGDEAWECARRARGLHGAWREHRDRGVPLGPLVAAFHPAARVSRESMLAPWGPMYAWWREVAQPA